MWTPMHTGGTQIRSPTTEAQDRDRPMADLTLMGESVAMPNPIGPHGEGWYLRVLMPGRVVSHRRESRKQETGVTVSVTDKRK